VKPAQAAALVAVILVFAGLAVGSMLGGGVFLLFTGFLGLGIGLAVYGFLHAKAIRDELRTLAQRHRWEFIESDKQDRPHRFKGFAPFGVGGGRTALNILAGKFEGMPFEAFTYRYTTSNGKHQQTHQHEVVAVPMPLHGPALRISPEHIGHKLADALGASDIDFESDAFSRRFWIQCDDRRFAYDVIPPATMELLLQHGGNWTWQWRGTTLVLSRQGTVRADDVLPMLRLANGFKERLPRHLLAERRP
jgi:hypothetical protein